ncbi:hypothetical protein [Pirellulimonas nuda]|uniref:hypothetical protein n=1 Tax=Pirellulimonas nuda TaxID=2528009 RepID=UPI0018D4D1CB|nr:hypothetical protein [Pirellulimonas nuda]
MTVRISVTYVGVITVFITVVAPQSLVAEPQPPPQSLAAEPHPQSLVAAPQPQSLVACAQQGSLQPPPHGEPQPPHAQALPAVTASTHADSSPNT